MSTPAWEGARSCSCCRARVIIEHVNMVKRHQRPTAAAAGGIIEREAPYVRT
jgi:ribosomal protein L24